MSGMDSPSRSTWRAGSWRTSSNSARSKGLARGADRSRSPRRTRKYYNLPEVSGVLVQEATAGGPAARAGLRQGDVLYSVDGKVVQSPNGLQNLIAQMRPGTEVTLRIYREGSPRDFRVRLDEAPLNATERPAPEPQAPAAEEKLGIGVQELTPELADRLGYAESGGVVITQVTPLGPASRRGVAIGEKILQINGEPVAAPDDVRRILGGSSRGRWFPCGLDSTMGPAES